MLTHSDLLFDFPFFLIFSYQICVTNLLPRVQPILPILSLLPPLPLPSPLHFLSAFVLYLNILYIHTTLSFKNTNFTILEQHPQKPIFITTTLIQETTQLFNSIILIVDTHIYMYVWCLLIQARQVKIAKEL